MNDTLLEEYIQRAGLVTYEDLARQMGAAKKILMEPLVSQFRQKKIFLSYMVDGKETLLSRHVMFCLAAARPDPTLTAPAQEIVFWVCDNPGSTRNEIKTTLGFDDETFKRAFGELLRKTQITPIDADQTSCIVEDVAKLPLMKQVDFKWCAADTWYEELHRPSRYNDLEYCLSELRRILSGYFDNAEINDLLYNYY